MRILNWDTAWHSFFCPSVASHVVTPNEEGSLNPLVAIYGNPLLLSSLRLDDRFLIYDGKNSSHIQVSAQQKWTSESPSTFLCFQNPSRLFRWFVLLLRSTVAVMTHLIFDSLSPTYSTVAHGNHCTNKLTHILSLLPNSLSGVLMHAEVTLLSYTLLSLGKSHSRLQVLEYLWATTSRRSRNTCRHIRLAIPILFLIGK